ncbi:MAG: type II toxin-antitoxin system VapC family toxin [Terriglobia bacterium]
MTLFYLDSSAWLKRYFLEPGSGWMMRLFEIGIPLASSVLGYLEVASALARQPVSRKRDEDQLARLQQQLEEDWGELTGFPLTDETVARAVRLARGYKLRGADALHLATALGVNDALAGTGNSLVLIASDENLLAAAQQTGLAVENPVIAASP